MVTLMSHSNEAADRVEEFMPVHIGVCEKEKYITICRILQHIVFVNIFLVSYCGIFISLSGNM